MEKSDMNSYPWRGLTDDEYDKLKADVLILYKVLDLIFIFLMLAAMIVIITEITSIINSASSPEGLIIAIITTLALIFGRLFLRRLGLKDIEERNYEAAEGIFKGIKLETTHRHERTINLSYAIVQMPDNKYLIVEEELGKLSKLVEDDKILVIRVKNKNDEYLLNIL